MANTTLDQRDGRIVFVTTLFVAAGGGGDAVGVLLAHRLLAPDDTGPVLIATCAWERLIVDPVPGPRSPEGFAGLVKRGSIREVVSTSDTVPPGHSTLPRLAAETNARIFLLDLAGGVVNLADQIVAIVEQLRADSVVLVDTGGDAIATGSEVGLLSPLADSMFVAAVLRSELAGSLGVLAPGADGELSESDVLTRLTNLGASFKGCITPDDVHTVEHVLTWHPTEASAIAAAGALGDRGAVAMRRGGNPFRITDRTPELWALTPSLEHLPLAKAVIDTQSLDEAATTIARQAPNELEYETAKARSLAEGTSVVPSPAESLEDDRAAGATHVTLRRIRELTGSSIPVGHFGAITLWRTPSGLFQLLDK